MNVMSYQILVVEDDQDFAEMLLHFLRVLKYQPTLTRRLDDAFHYLDQQRPDLIILDLNLNGQSGWDVLDHAWVTYGFRSIPVIVSSAQDDRDNLQVARTHQVNAFLVKPFTHGELRAIVRDVMSSFSGV